MAQILGIEGMSRAEVSSYSACGSFEWKPLKFSYAGFFGMVVLRDPKYRAKASGLERPRCGDI